MSRMVFLFNILFWFINYDSYICIRYLTNKHNKKKVIAGFVVTNKKIKKRKEHNQVLHIKHKNI